MIKFPTVYFPQNLDSNENLFKVYNTSEARLYTNFHIEDDTIYIEPREWESRELWAEEGGILNLEGELVYYEKPVFEYNTGTVGIDQNGKPITMSSPPSLLTDETGEKTYPLSYRRVIGFTNLIRGLYNTKCRNHMIGEWVRGYVMAEHHNFLQQAILGSETLIGIDNSTDHESIDYRLRDLSELIIERDDTDCPYGVFWYELLSEDQGVATVQFHIVIIGTYDSFEFSPYQGGDLNTTDLNPIYTYNMAGKTNLDDIIDASLKILYKKCCIIFTLNDADVEPCTFAIFEPPVLTCPEIVPFIPPIIPIPCPEITCDIPICEPCTISTCEPLTPTTLTIDVITVTIPPVVVTVVIESPTVVPTVPTEFPQVPENEGACFMLVPCGRTAS